MIGRLSGLLSGEASLCSELVASRAAPHSTQAPNSHPTPHELHPKATDQIIVRFTQSVKDTIIIVINRLVQLRWECTHNAYVYRNTAMPIELSSPGPFLL